MTEIPRLVLAAARSGSGKTTVACALLQAFVERGLAPASFKCGPDYIDPMFHSRIIGAKSRNLDLYFAGEDLARGLFLEGAKGCGVAVVEGVMGFYDGVGGSTTQASTYHVAQVLEAPVVLVAEPKGASLTLAATLRGLLDFRPDSRCAGVILNRCSPMTYKALAPVLERELGIPALGYLPPLPECALESRHLGLVTAAEVADLKEKMGRLAAQAEQTVDMEGLLALARSAPPLAGSLPEVAPVTDARPAIALAQDKAFCFYYPENLELLEKLGARLVPFSPLEEDRLPEGSCALYLGGGYPELYGQALSRNRALWQAVRRAHQQGMPILAECGGFMALHEAMEDSQGNLWPMAGLIVGSCRWQKKLGRFGYIQLEARQDTMLCSRGEAIRAHEFHYWDSDDCGQSCMAQKPVSGRQWPCVHGGPRLFAGYPHLYFYSNPRFAAGFVRAAAAYQKEWKL